jgi:hypothetical protein
VCTSALVSVVHCGAGYAHMMLSQCGLYDCEESNDCVSCAGTKM